MTDLELDQRLRDHTPAEYDELWDVFKPTGRVERDGPSRSWPCWRPG